MINEEHLKPVEQKFKMNAAQEKAFKQKTLNTLKAFIDICDQNNIMYYAAYGTVLGAVRHKGMIPWDDDIDVYLTRTEYNKLLELKKDLFNGKYDIIDENTPGYYLPFAKFVDVNTTIWEYEEFPYTFGTFVDLFILDSVNPTDAEQVEACKSCQKLFFKYQRGKFRRIPLNAALKQLLNGKPKDIINRTLDWAIYKPMSKYFHKRYLEQKNKIKTFQGDYYLQNAVSAFEENCYTKDWFGEGEILPFEDFCIRVPLYYDKYLSSRYGEYMVLPPVEQRGSNHQHCYINLDRGMNINEVKATLKNQRM